MNDQELHNLLLSNVSGDVETLEQLGPTVKAVYKSGRQDAFVDQLSAFIAKKEFEIEKMCNFHYQEFVQSVDQLLKVRQGTVSVKNKIVDLNKELQESGGKITQKKQELMEYRQTQQNVETAIEALQTCLRVLELANKANSQIENHKFYSALRTLEELHTAHLRNVIQYDFAKHMQECIPTIKDSVKDAVTKEMKEWLYSIRESSRKVGRIAMDQMKKRQQLFKSRSTRDMTMKSQNLSSSIEIVMNEENEANVIDNDQVKVDFRPIYQCLHIYDELGKRSEFKQQYEEDRRAQANLVLQQQFTLKDGNLNGLETLLMDIVGFFIIEHVVMNSTTDFRSKAGVDMLWDMVTASVVTVITQSLQDCNDPELFLSLKLSLITFLQTLDGYGFSVKKLMELLLALFERYSELTKMYISEKFNKIVEEDKYTPMVVNNNQEYATVLEAYRLKEDKSSAISGFPRTLPFSSIFPTCCSDIKQFINGFYEFAEGFAQNFGEMDDILKKSLDSLLINHVNQIMLQKLKGNNFSQVVQIIINLEYFEYACAEFEKLLMERRSSHRGGHIVLAATTTFAETRKLAEKRIFELVNDKIDDFLEVAEYDWTPSQLHKAPSAYLQEMVGFLTSTMTHTLANLPISIKTFIYFDALDHLAAGLSNMLLDKRVKKINSIFVENFNLDVTFMEMFVKNLKDPNLMDTLLELRQTVSLLRCDTFDEYLNPSIRAKKYSRLRMANVILLLDKVIKDTSSLSLNQKDKTKRRSIETVVKQLKSMQ